ncbi:MAG: hypothetical protein ACD_12C00635G0004 [uncultured bacterium]|nr:MAG: hypothetical protein ACD_12C00635G0004 [uncultured bacterium]
MLSSIDGIATGSMLLAYADLTRFSRAKQRQS